MKKKSSNGWKTSTHQSRNRKVKNTFTLVLYFTALFFVSCSNDTPRIPQLTIADLYVAIEKDMAEEDAAFLKKYRPDYVPSMLAIFFTHRDDIPRAIVTSWMQRHPTGLYDWRYYYFQDNQWRKSPSGEFYFVHPMDFYILTEEGQKSKLILGNSHITVDKDGKLKLVPIPGFEIKEDANREVRLLNPKSPNDKIERAQVQTFNPNDHTQEK